MKKLIKPLGVILPVSLALALIAAFILLFTPLGFPTIRYGTNGFGCFDFRFSYTADNVMTIFSHYNGDLVKEWTIFYSIDFVFGFLISVFMFTLPLTFYLKSDRMYLVYRTALFSAAMVLVFNTLENIQILRLMNVTPYFSEGEADIASGLTTLKWVFAGIWGLSWLVILIINLFIEDEPAKPKRLAK